MDRLLVDLLIVLVSAILSIGFTVWGWRGIAAKEIVLRGNHYKGIVAVFLSAILMCMGTSTGCLIAYQVGLFIQGMTPYLLLR